jgi:hypothetical protein
MAREARYGGREDDELRSKEASLGDWSADSEIAQGAEQRRLDTLMGHCITACRNGKAAREAAENALEEFKAALGNQGFSKSVIAQMIRSASRPGSAYTKSLNSL